MTGASTDGMDRYLESALVGGFIGVIMSIPASMATNIALHTPFFVLGGLFSAAQEYHSVHADTDRSTGGDA